MCTERNINLQTEHLPGQLSFQVGQESRTMREVEAISVPSNSGSDGAVGSGFICITADKTASPLLQLEARPRSRGNRYLHAELGNLSGVYQSTMVSATLLPCQGEKTGSKDSTNNTFVENPIVVPISAGASGGLPLEDSSTAIPGINVIGAGYSDSTKSAPTGCLAHLRQSYSS